MRKNGLKPRCFTGTAGLQGLYPAPSSADPGFIPQPQGKEIAGQGRERQGGSQAKKGTASNPWQSMAVLEMGLGDSFSGR
jgi:hypothetical protein